MTSNLLLPLFDKVDMVEQCSSFVEEAKKGTPFNPFMVVAGNKLFLLFTGITSSKMGHFYCSGLQDFVFEEKYDVIWIQWVIGHLHDNDLLVFLHKCKQALTPNGLLCIKDNVRIIVFITS